MLNPKARAEGVQDEPESDVAVLHVLGFGVDKLFPSGFVSAVSSLLSEGPFLQRDPISNECWYKTDNHYLQNTACADDELRFRIPLVIRNVVSRSNPYVLIRLRPKTVWYSNAVGFRFY